MPGIMKLKPHSTPQKRKPPKFAGSSEKEPKRTAISTANSARKLTESDRYAPPAPSLRARLSPKLGQRAENETDEKAGRDGFRLVKQREDRAPAA